eukprot:gene14990-6144_t
MDTEIITLAGILDFFKDDTNTVRKGELKFKSDFVLDLRIDELTVNAKVRATMKDKSYSVSLTIDGSGGVKQAICECPRGKWISKTDLPNSWIARPKKAAKQEVRTISDLFPHPRPDYKAASRKVDEADKQFLFDQLSRSAACPLQWIIGSEPPNGIINLKGVATNDVGVLEIKCPWKHCDHKVAAIIKEEVENKRSTSFYLNLDATLNESHSYWHQVQGEMIAANATKAHFVVWTTREIKVIYVSRSTSWAETNIPKLKDFYANEFLTQCIN